MKAKSIVKFSAVCLVIAILAYVAAFGIQLFGYYIPASFDEEFGIKKGFDLAGGSVIVFEPEVDDLSTVTEDQIKAAVAALRLRLDANGLNEATVSEQIGDGQRRLRVEIPAVTDPNEAISYLGAMASLSFKDPSGTEVINGTHVKDAFSDNEDGQIKVKLHFTSEGQALFAEATSRLVGQALSIFVDDVCISSPNVNEAINSETCEITGGFNKETATLLANQIKSGTLPFALEPISQSSVGAQLGDDALSKSLIAGGIGLLLVMLFMLVIYRLNGLVANIALIGYVAIVTLIINGFGIQLTLPGIAGIILTIGTAVDANVIIFERIKEELKTGKSLRASVDAGFKRAFSAIVDANITTIIAAAALWYFGSGTIIGFAKTLFIGTLVSMFTAIFVTRFLLRQIVGFGIKNKKAISA